MFSIIPWSAKLFKSETWSELIKVFSLSLNERICLTFNVKYLNLSESSVGVIAEEISAST